MSEKRILCVKVSGNCRHLREVESFRLDNHFNVLEVGNYCSEGGCGCKKISKDQCANCNKAEYVGITRDQAIRKMCDGYFKAKNKGRTERERVKAALNSLLEGKDDER